MVVSEEAREALAGETTAVQREPRGTGDAVAAARDALAGFDGDVLVVSGDTPLVTTELLEQVLETHRRETPAVTVLSYEPPGQPPYGRIIRSQEGELQAIVEERDATPEQLAIRELNASLYVFNARDLWWALERLGADNAQGELYLTDTVGDLVRDGRLARRPPYRPTTARRTA